MGDYISRSQLQGFSLWWDVFCCLVSVSSLVFWLLWPVVEERISTQVGGYNMVKRSGGGDWG